MYTLFIIQNFNKAPVFCLSIGSRERIEREPNMYRTVQHTVDAPDPFEGVLRSNVMGAA